MSSRTGKLAPWELAAIVAAASAVISPFFFLGQASGHDFAFHLSSWMDVARQWRLGVIFPRWAALANYGYGEPRFIFYPPISWCLGAALGLLLPWKMTPPAFTLLSLVLAGVCMHRLARTRISQDGALVAALIYAVNPYFLMTVYLRSDYAELLGDALFPLAVHYALNFLPNAFPPKTVEAPRSAARKIAPLAAVYGLIWLANPPSAVVASYALALLLVVCCIFARSGRPLLNGAISLGLGLALAGVYLVPAAFEQRWVNITQALSAGLRYNENFLFTWILDPEHNLFNLTVSAVAILMIALAGIAAVISHRHLAHGKEFPSGELDGSSPPYAGNTGALWASLLTLAVASTLMMFPICGVIWRYAPKLRFVQFPWRWLFVLAVALAYFLGDAATIGDSAANSPLTSVPANSVRIMTRVLSGVLIAVVLAGTGVALAADAWWYTQDVPVMLTAIQSGQGYEGTDEYCPRGGDQYDLPRNAPLVELRPADDPDVSSAQGPPLPGSVRIESWQPERKVFSVDIAMPERAALRLLNYPAWQIRINGQRAVSESDSGSAQMSVRLPAGTSRVDVSFGRTPDRTIGAALSVAAMLIWVVLMAAMLKDEQREAPEAADKNALANQLSV
jgi:hypothetical protein